MNKALTEIDEVRQALDKTTDPAEAKQIRDQAAAIRHYIKQQGASLEELNQVARVKCWAEIKTGRLLAEVPRDERARMDLHDNDLCSGGQRVRQSVTEYRIILDEGGINDRMARRWQVMAKLPDEAIERYFDKCDIDRKEIVSSGLLALAKKATVEEHIIVSEQTIEAPFDPPPIFLANCIDFLASFEDNYFDLLLTDPPYKTDVLDIESFAKEWVPLALSKVKPDGRAYICIGAYPDELKVYLDILLNQDKFILDNPLIWTYRNTLGQTPKMKYNLNYQVILHLYSAKSRQLDTSITNEMFSVQDINAPDGRLGDRYHTWQKPKELARRLITHSTIQGDKVIDPFACTGTFLIAASQLQRESTGCDISLDNLRIAEQRGCDVISE